jgi:hypothetical protein
MQRPASKTLAEIKTFLDANPTEVITIFIEDYVKTPNGIPNLFANAGLMKYWYPVSSMPQNGADWPTLAQILQRNQRLIVFTDVSSKEATEGVAYQWRYTTENQCTQIFLYQFLQKIFLKVNHASRPVIAFLRLRNTIFSSDKPKYVHEKSSKSLELITCSRTCKFSVTASVFS